ncbi:MAG: hypothetical protein EOO41_01160, partial [Methanobacteriota archaeon]
MYPRRQLLPRPSAQQTCELRGAQPLAAAMNSLLDDYDSNGDSGEEVALDDTHAAVTGPGLSCTKGDWPSFLYIDCSAVLRIPQVSALLHAYRQCASADWCTRVHDTLDAHAADVRDEVGLHVSLTRSFALRYSQIDDVHKQVQHACAATPAFDMHFDGAQAYVNDDSSKTFIGALVSVGLPHVLHLIASADGVMTALGKPTYYQVCPASGCACGGKQALVYSLLRGVYAVLCYMPSPPLQPPDPHASFGVADGNVFAPRAAAAQPSDKARRDAHIKCLADAGTPASADAAGSCVDPRASMRVGYDATDALLSPSARVRARVPPVHADESICHACSNESKIETEGGDDVRQAPRAAKRARRDDATAHERDADAATETSAAAALAVPSAHERGLMG